MDRSFFPSASSCVLVNKVSTVSKLVWRDEIEVCDDHGVFLPDQSSLEFAPILT